MFHFETVNAERKWGSQVRNLRPPFNVGEGGCDFQNHTVEQAPSELLLKSLLDV